MADNFGGQMRRFLMLGLLLIFVFGSVTAADYEIYTQISVSKLTKQQFLDIHGEGMDIIEYLEDGLEIIATADNLEWLDAQGISYEIEIADLKAHYKSLNKDALDMGGFMTFSEIESHLLFLKLTYPTLMTDRFSIGQSVEGREIWAVKVSDNPAIDEDEPEVLYISLIHAREPAAAASLLNFLEHMLSNYGLDSEVTYLVNNREMYFIPVQNPDGYVWNETTDPAGGGLWRKNRSTNVDFTRGVDLNRNYGFKWGYDNVGSSSVTNSEVYRGPSAFSEPETQAVRDFTILRNFVIVHNFHTFSDLELWPPGYDREFSKFEKFYQNLGDSMTQFNGYTPEVGWRLYPTNGAADDWHWGDTILKPRQISLTCEIGSTGFWPNPSEISGLVSENIWPNLFLARIAENPYQIGPPMAPTAFVADSIADSGDYTISWSSDDTLNPAESYSLYELTNKSSVADDAESNYGYWTTERFTLTGTRAHSGLFSWTEIQANRANHWLLANTPYQVNPNDTLKFWIWYDLEEDWDYFYAQVSTDGGYEFTNLANDMTTNFNPNNTNTGNGITGSSGGNWVEAKFDLSPFEGEQIIVRLSYFTDNAALNEGVYIDDIQNIDFFGTEVQLAPGLVQINYAITDKTPGDYWYRVKSKDAENQESDFSNIVFVQVPLPYVPGDASGDGEVNLLDLTFLVDRIFRGGPPPDPLLAGDCNCDSSVDVLDLTFMVDFVFRGGPEPNCPF
jgi:hypothetical protein